MRAPDKKSKSVDECTVFELHCLLEKKGWRGEHPPPNAKATDLAYKKGGDKVWYLHRNAQTFSWPYFAALLKAKSHKLPVKPFATTAHYESLIKGVMPLDGKGGKRTKKKTQKFDFEASLHPGVDIPETKATRKRMSSNVSRPPRGRRLPSRATHGVGAEFHKPTEPANSDPDSDSDSDSDSADSAAAAAAADREKLAKPPKPKGSDSSDSSSDSDSSDSSSDSDSNKSEHPESKSEHAENNSEHDGSGAATPGSSIFDDSDEEGSDAEMPMAPAPMRGGLVI